MDCGEACELISANADGELGSDDQRLMRTHLESCTACSHFAVSIERLDRQTRVRPAEPVPDLVASVTSRARPARLGRGGWMRPALAWVAAVLLAQNLPALILGTATGTDAHSARHIGAFGTALAIGFVYVAWKPHRAVGMLPFTAALVATTLISVVADIASGTRTPVGELVHVSEVVGLALLWMIAGSPGWRNWSGRVRIGRRRDGLSGLDPLQ